jgi:hypothetical protein
LLVKEDFVLMTAATGRLRRSCRLCGGEPP